MLNQLSLFEDGFQIDYQSREIVPQKEKDGEGVTWAYSKTRVLNKGDGVIEIIPTKLKADGTPKKYPLNSKKEVEKKSMPIKKEEDAEAILGYLMTHKKPMYSVAFQLGINLGLRANELLERKWEEILDQNGDIRIVWDIEDLSDGLNVDQKKTGKQRRIYLNDACKVILEQYRKSCKNTSGYLFPSREGCGNHLTVGMLYKNIKEAAKACGVAYNVGTHSLRQTWGYRQYNRMGRTEDALVYLQHFFGHSNPIITMRYIGIFGEEEKKAFHEGSYDVFSKVLSGMNGELPETWI